jgi:hypothetical protein
MAKFAFTQASLKAFFETHSRALAWDETQRGLAVYATAEGQITLFAQSRVGARQRKKAWGAARRIDHPTAADQGRRVRRRRSARSRHPRGASQGGRAQITFGDAYLAHRESLIRRMASKNTLPLYASNYRLCLAKRQNRALSSLTRGELREWHDGWKKIGPTGTNNTARMLRAI